MSANLLVLYCGTGFIKSLYDKLFYHFDTRPLMAPCDFSADLIRAMRPDGIIVSGSGSYVKDVRAEKVDQRIYDLGIPILGICYGMQRMAVDLGGDVKKMAEAEKEGVLMKLTEEGITSPLYDDFADEAAPVWMSHNCKVTKMPPGFVSTGKTKMTEIASMENKERGMYGIQYHPEHYGKDISAQAGTAIIANFLYRVCQIDAPQSTKATLQHG